MTQYTNEKSIPLSVALWLAYDSYEHSDDPFTISATSLLKPTKELALQRLPGLVNAPEDVGSLRASRVGTAVHDSIRYVWEDKDKRDIALKRLGYPQRVIDRVRVNPDTHDDDYINVYTERRTNKKLGRWTITGEFDFWADGAFEDFKNTGTYTYQHGTKTTDYIKQLSVYRWLFQDLPSSGLGRIQMLFSNWSASQTFQPNYPPSDIVTMELQLWDPMKTEAWIKEQLKALDDALDNLMDQSMLPTCSDKECWKGESTFKYYSKPDAKRASKNFDSNATAAYAWLQEKGCGEIKEFPGEARYCKSYCSSREVCDQGKRNST